MQQEVRGHVLEGRPQTSRLTGVVTCGGQCGSLAPVTSSSARTRGHKDMYLRNNLLCRDRLNLKNQFKFLIGNSIKKFSVLKQLNVAKTFPLLHSRLYELCFKTEQQKTTFSLPCAVCGGHWCEGGFLRGLWALPVGGFRTPECQPAHLPLKGGNTDVAVTWTPQLASALVC